MSMPDIFLILKNIGGQGKQTAGKRAAAPGEAMKGRGIVWGI